MSKKKLIITVGCPGSGKTTWTNELCNKKIGETGVVSLDDLRMTMFGQIPKQSFYSAGLGDYKYLDHFYDLMTAQVEKLIMFDQVKQVVVCNTNLTNHSIHTWKGVAIELGLKLEFVVFPKTQSQLLEINKTREKTDRVPVKYLKDVIKNFDNAYAYIKGSKYKYKEVK